MLQFQTNSADIPWALAVIGGCVILWLIAYAWECIEQENKALDQWFSSIRKPQPTRKVHTMSKPQQLQLPKSPTYQELTGRVAELELQLSEQKRIAEELRKNVTDFMPNGHHMVADGAYKALHTVLHEYNEIMPLLIVAEAIELGLLDKENLKDFTPEQVKKIDELILDRDNSHYLLLMDSWLERNGKDYGFGFRFVNNLDKYKKG